MKAGINRPAELIAQVRYMAERGEASPAAGTAEPEAAGAPGEGFGARLRRYLMSGVSYMVPFVAAGGLLIALSFAIGGHEIANAPSVAEHFVWTEGDSWAALFNQIGGAAFGFLVPVLAGYIPFAAADPLARVRTRLCDADRPGTGGPAGRSGGGAAGARMARRRTSPGAARRTPHAHSATQPPGPVAAGR
ncbi:EIIBCA-Man [Streptomyces sp. MP131-18]|nr:EIIBCA-Man [Streptomyces sp. MP131-18]